jgi:hypothetical protein
MKQRRCEFLLEKEDDLGIYKDMLSEAKEGGFAYSEFTTPKQGPDKGNQLEYCIHIFPQPEFTMSFDELLGFLKKQIPEEDMMRSDKLRNYLIEKNIKYEINNFTMKAIYKSPKDKDKLNAALKEIDLGLN